VTTRAAETEAVWKDFRTRLFSFVRSRVATREDAEDILQDVFTRIHESAARIPELESVSGWVHRIARNAVVDHHRRRAAGARAAEALATEDPLPPIEDESAAARELAPCLLPLVKDLPERYASAIELTELAGLTQREAAERLGISLSGIKTRVQRGRSKLRGKLLDCCHVELDRRGGVVDVAPRRAGSCACGCR